MTLSSSADNSTKSSNWLRICVTTPASLSEIVASFLCDITGQGIELNEAGKEKETVIAYLPKSSKTEAGKRKQIEDFLDRLRQSLPTGEKLDISYQSLPDEDWNRNWKKHFKPEHITPRLVIKPSWEDYTPAAEEHVIEMDPGMAFGTGHHASTRLCMRFIDRLLTGTSPPKTVLDVGTGTGILAMAAVLLGARSAFAIDNDPEAVQVAANNVQRNKLQNDIKISGTDVRDIHEQFDLVIANIIHDTLIALAPYLIEKLIPGAHLILAGILVGEQEQNIINTYNSLGLDHVASEQEGEWASLLFSL